MDEEQIIQFVKKVTLEAGGCDPVMFVKGSAGKIAVAMKDFGPTSDIRERHMLNAGAYTAQKHNVGELEKLVFACEAWAAPARTEHFVMPSADPNRIEVVIINSLDAATREETIKQFEMVRDHNKKLIDLKPVFLPEAGSVHGILLPAFQKGYQMIRPTTN